MAIVISRRASCPWDTIQAARHISVRAASREQLQAFHGAWYGPNQTTLIVVGDVSLDDARETMERNLGDWSRGRSEPVP